MSYLSKLAIDTSRRESVRILSSPRRIHGELTSLPGTEATGDGERLLWRIDHFKNTAWLYLVTPGAVDLTELHAKIGVADIAPVTRNYSDALTGIVRGQRLRFRLRANVIKHAVDIGSPRPDRPELKRGKPVGLITKEDQEAWLIRQGERHGFEVDLDSLAVSPRPMERITKRGKGGTYERTVSLNVVQFDGILTVSDTAAFLRALSGGIGKAKAYGLGLLSVGPAGPRA